MTGPDLPDWDAAAAAYDAVASRYDRIPDKNRINAYMRRLSLERLSATFREGMKVLELGCGTGEEALQLAAQGIRVVAVDPSEEMVRIARAKARAFHLTEVATFVGGRARDILGSEVEEGAPYDGAYASFSLAYEPDLHSIAAALDRILRPGATLLASLPSRVCLVEFVLSLLLGRPSYAGQRLRSWHWHRVGPHRVPIRTYTPLGIADAMSPHFTLKRAEGLPSVVPPAYTNRWYAAFGALPDVVESVDAVLRTRFPFRLLGDHVLAELRHRGASDLPREREP